MGATLQPTLSTLAPGHQCRFGNLRILPWKPGRQGSQRGSQSLWGNGADSLPFPALFFAFSSSRYTLSTAKLMLKLTRVNAAAVNQKGLDAAARASSTRHYVKHRQRVFRSLLSASRCQVLVIGHQSSRLSTQPTQLRVQLTHVLVLSSSWLLPMVTF